MHGQATAGEAFQVVADLLDVVEIVQAVAAGEQFVEGLRTTQEQQAEQRHLWRHQFQALAQGVLPAVGAAAITSLTRPRPSSWRRLWPTWPGVRFITGSRLVFWLQARTRA